LERKFIDCVPFTALLTKHSLSFIPAFRLGIQILTLEVGVKSVLVYVDRNKKHRLSPWPLATIGVAAADIEAPSECTNQVLKEATCTAMVLYRQSSSNVYCCS
jgi:hypothetical protein